MRLPGTEMHTVTFVFVILEIIMLIFQLSFYLFRPQDKARLWYLILLILLLDYNICSGLFPDARIGIPVYIQNIFAYASGFFMASYFPFYFYKAFNLSGLRFHALYGVALFLILPFFLFFVLIYSINKDLLWARKYGLIIPFIYSISLLCGITKAVIKRYKENNNKKELETIIGVYLAVVPWVSLTVIVYLDVGQTIETLVTNFGFLVITVLYIRSTVIKHREEYIEFQEFNAGIDKKVEQRTQQLKALHDQELSSLITTLNKPNGDDFSLRLQKSAKLYNLTTREIEIVKLIAAGNKYHEIAKVLFISEGTVKTHVVNIFKKADASNKVQLLNKLNSQR